MEKDETNRVNLSMGPRTQKKLKDALLIRDLILARITAKGKFENVANFGPVLSWSGNGIKVLYRTPFQKLPPAKENLKYVAALIKQRAGYVKNENQSYGLDV